MKEKLEEINVKEILPMKKNIWSVQKTMGFKKTEQFDIDLSPGNNKIYIYIKNKIKIIK